MNKVNVEKALKLLQQDLGEHHPYKVIKKPAAVTIWPPATHRKALPGEYSPEMNPEDWEPQD